MKDYTVRMKYRKSLAFWNHSAQEKNIYFYSITYSYSYAS